MPGDPHEPGPFAFADARGSMRSSTLPVRASLRVLRALRFCDGRGSGDDPVEDAVGYFSRIGPAARALAELEADERARFADLVGALAERNLYDGIVSLRAAAWIVTGRKA